MSATLLTIPQVAERLQSSERFVYDEIRRKNLRASKVNGWRIAEDDLETYIDAKANVSRVRRTA